MSNLRIAGLASGMDTDAMVKSLMRVERLKVDRFEQNKQTALWRQEQYNNINKLFANFILNTRKDMGLNKVNMRGAISSTKYNNLDYIRKSTSSNDSVATASSTSQSVNGTFEIEVDKLATSGNFASDDLTNVDLGKKLSFKINGNLIEVGDGSKDITLSDITKAINSFKKVEDGKEVSLGITAFYDEKNGRLFMQTMETGLDKIL